MNGGGAGQRAADEQRQRSVGGLELVAAVLELLDPREHRLAARGVSFDRSKPSSRAFITMLLRPARSLMRTWRELPTDAGSMCS